MHHMHTGRSNHGHHGQRSQSQQRNRQSEQNLTPHELVKVQDQLTILAQAMQGKGAQISFDNEVVIATPADNNVAVTDLGKGVHQVIENAIMQATGHEITTEQRQIIAQTFKVTTIAHDTINFRTISRVAVRQNAVHNLGLHRHVARLMATRLIAIWPKLKIQTTMPTVNQLTATILAILHLSETRNGVKLFSNKALTHLCIGGFIVTSFTEVTTTPSIPTRPTPWATAELTKGTTTTLTKREPVGSGRN